MTAGLDLLDANDRQGEYPQSWYAASCDLQETRKPLGGDTQNCDVCIIGAGYTGLSAALHLADKGYSVIVLEAHRAGWGASGRNGGQTGSGQRRDQDFLEKEYGDGLARTYWEMGEASKQLVRNLIRTHNIDCDPVEGIIEADHRKKYVPHSKAYVEKLNNKYGYDKIRFVDEKEMRQLVKSPAYFGGSLDSGAFHIHPLSFALGLARACETAGVIIHENSRVTRITRNCDAKGRVKIETKKASLKSGYLVLACNGYLGDLEKDVAARVMPINNFILATEPLSMAKVQDVMTSQAAVADSKYVINYFRFAQSRHEKANGTKRMVFGGGENYGYKFPKDIKTFVRKPMLEIFPQLENVQVEYGWGGTLAITMKRLPHFARIAGNIISCSGYSGHGIGNATHAGQLVAEAVSGQAERFDLMARMNIPRFPGGMHLRYPLLIAAMTWYSLRDRFI